LETCLCFPMWGVSSWVGGVLTLQAQCLLEWMVSCGFCAADAVLVEEFRNSHEGSVTDAGAGTGSSYLCCSNCDGFKHGALTIAGGDH